MINRENWLDVKEYLAHKRQTGRDGETVLRIKNYLRHFLEWADVCPFAAANKLDPAFPGYLGRLEKPGGGRRLGAATMKKTCENVQLFLEFMRQQHPGRYRGVSAAWIETIAPSVADGVQSEFHEHLFYTVEQMRKVATAPVSNLKEERDRAAMCFLFLSAMRAQAFVSLPVKCVDLGQMRILQLPSMGVRTKNRKAAKTTLLRIPDLLEVVRAWDARVRAEGMELWYPVINPWQQFVKREVENWVSRRSGLWRGMKVICGRAGIPFMSPHKLRHGHIYYMMKRVKDIEQLKTLSQNVMHNSVATTDGIYGRLVADDISDMYEELGE